jgi:hypothetical protein
MLILLLKTSLEYVDNFFKYILNGCCLEGKGDKAALGGGGSGEKD